jgi:hypothetical protein
LIVSARFFAASASLSSASKQHYRRNAQQALMESAAKLAINDRKAISLTSSEGVSQ